MTPWLTVIGIGEDGLAGLSAEAKAALAAAEFVFGGSRHLVLAQAGARGRHWPVPFSVAPLLACKSSRVVALCSGDPFWFGAGSVLAAKLDSGEWWALPAPSSFSLAAARLGWRLEQVVCLGLHAAPFARARRHLTHGARLICLLRGAESVAAFAAWLEAMGFGASRLWVLEALGGARERVLAGSVAEIAALEPGRAPVAVAVEVAGGLGLPRAPGLPDELFVHDGQITKRAVRALTISALGPRPGEHLWDIGLGAGSVSVEWLLASGTGRASGVEADAARAARAQSNAEAFGVEERLHVLQASAPEGLDALAMPDAIFIGGGANAALLERLWALAPAGTRLVANGVTLESEALFTNWAAAKGGALLRVEMAGAAPLGRMRGWMPARPVLQWSVVL
ncbi:bifunctional cobalt-precorrin-7 (C(5))-methyltransferase/cobalt-precorrin-6B (C(15))-methyltransferase [Acidocella aminolytica]|jgi:precorrin-6Y C5,15-methyltransferase (decarboxylating)|uniref:Cobalamin (Vitamin B12) biosynthesis protein/precorrin-6Y C5,15-methyltransferase n=1 Tax=Acidocella aminolytica 101 = DSM 11237 TaxID=1120923 RepID=A0A0D6PDD7_9PROT|nr:bifunctional cobalt-precorrin-7 (C(5))-methyltransferase/cobalt-precorrin-6B (C(15))-methyltransferase [Acidocella aminolytica]GAN79667.1 cobalamin (vitamin B12) biosynthesis protein/precorrin-6Y C5,15-methyltransferase [Acidocella aminolytica 101 = DSM 11237]GBQ41246.1 cobalamin biosynthesis protein precorrin-6Y C5,15-methyltransferase [Acidocella aminolytica 101 = DSM 11237]SHF05116.1 precorrin-6Y C5,15-methyltransferase (decarboxylating) [Acidocella aminolytica 101 = DSM 11237]